MGSRGEPSLRGSFVTGSRRGDLLVLVAFLGLTVCSAPWLRVYYRITAVELELARIEPDGGRTPLEPPPELDFSAEWNRKPGDLSPWIERAFRRLAAAESPDRPGASYELTARYSFNSPARDRSVTWRAP